MASLRVLTRGATGDGCVCVCAGTLYLHRPPSATVPVAPHRTPGDLRSEHAAAHVSPSVGALALMLPSAPGCSLVSVRTQTCHLFSSLLCKHPIGAEASRGGRSPHAWQLGHLFGEDEAQRPCTDCRCTCATSYLYGNTSKAIWRHRWQPSDAGGKP